MTAGDMAHVGSSAKKSKKKDNFLRQTKRQGKKGNFGKGRRLSEDEYNYYMRVFEQLKHVDGEGKEILVRNFFRELQREEQERSLACNQIVSRILDDALPFADVAQVLRLSEIFATDLRPLCIDPFASHVIQTLLTLSLKYIQKGAEQKRFEESSEEEEPKEVTVSITEEQAEEFRSFLEKVGRFVYNNLEDFVCDTYASHIIRSVLEVCSGVEVQHSAKSSQKSHLTHSLCRDEGKTLAIPQKLKQLLKDFALRFKMLPKLSDIMACECGSAVLQSLVSILGHVDEEKCQDAVEHLIQHGLPGVAAWYSDSQYQPEEDALLNLPPLFHDNPTTRLLEVMVTWCSSEQQSTIFKQYFQGKIKTLVQHRQANFAVQRLVAAWKDKETFGDNYEEVSKCLDVAVESGHAGVITALTQACRRLSSHQAQCMKALMELLGCWESEEHQAQFAMLLLRLQPRQQEVATGLQQDSRPPVSLQGSLALQDLLHFHKPIKVVTSILQSRSSDLQAMGCDPRGSHVVDAFISSATVGAKSREKLVYQFKGTYTALACSKHGSRSLEALWKVASVKARTQMCSELLADEQKLLDSQFGKIIYNNFKVGMFKRGDKADWQELIDKTQKKRKMFDDLLKEDVSEETKKKKKSKKKDAVSDEPEMTTGKSKKKKKLELEEFMFIDTEGV